jgi:general stress protein 26
MVIEVGREDIFLKRKNVMIMEKDLQNHDAVKKLSSLAGDIRFCMYSTIENGKIESRPMTTLDIDENGDVWFFTGRHTLAGREAGWSENVTLIYADSGKNSYLSVSGHSAVVEDEAKKDELWNIMSKAWFPGGKDDPDLVMIRVQTEEASYWDSTSSKMVLFFSMLKAAVTGNTPDSGDHGKLEL